MGNTVQTRCIRQSPRSLRNVNRALDRNDSLEGIRYVVPRQLVELSPPKLKYRFRELVRLYARRKLCLRFVICG